MVDNNTKNAIDYVVRGAVRAEIEGTVKRPNTLPLVDWQQTFFVRRTAGGEVMATIRHRLPLDPQPGQVWRIPMDSHNDSGRHISVKIEHVTYQWDGQKEAGEDKLAGWALNVYIECVRWTQ